ncbi:MAG: DUF3486 family protein [Leptolyngbyaceae cyanobacterium]
MAPRSKVARLPEEVRDALNARLLNSGFGDYEALSKWLDDQGFEISKSTLHRYGQGFEERLSALRVATQQAQAVAETVGDDENALGDSLVRLAQEKLFSLLLKVDQIDVENLDLPKMARAIADLNRSAVQQKKWQLELRKQVADVAEAVTNEVKGRGLGDDFAEQIRSRILGIGA